MGGMGERIFKQDDAGHLPVGVSGSCRGPVLREGFDPDFSFLDARFGNILNNLFTGNKMNGYCPNGQILQLRFFWFWRKV
jgi:hypothetical protein